MKEKVSIVYGRIIQKIDLYPVLLFFVTVLFKTFMTNKIFTSTGVTGVDEIGTIASAAYFAGYDWSGVMSHTIYYGFGYSILLAPVFIFFKNPATIHHILLFSSNVLIALCGVLAYYVLIRFFKLKRRGLALLIASISILYFPVNFYGNLLINESMLSFLTWLVLYILLQLNSDGGSAHKKIYSVLLSIILSYSLTVHSRSIVIIAVSVCVILCIYFVTKRKIVNPYFFIPVLVAGSIFAQFCVKIVQGSIWLSGSGEELTNSTEDLFVKFAQNLKFLFSYNGMKLYLSELLGQVYTMAILTYGIFAIACVTTVIFLRHFWKKRSICRCNNTEINKLTAVLFGTFGVVVTLLSSSLVALRAAETHVERGNSSKWFLYNRYWSIYMIILIVSGGYFLYSYRKSSKKIILHSLIIMLVLSFLFSGYLGFRFDGVENLSTGILYPFAGIGFWQPKENLTGTSFFKISLIVLFIFLAAMFFVMHKKIKTAYAIICIVMLINYIYVTYHITYPISDQLYDQFSEMVNIVDDSGYESEYIYTTEKFSMFQLWVQYLFPRFKVTYGIHAQENAIAVTNDLTEEIFSDNWNVAYHDSDGELLYEDLYVLVRGDDLTENLIHSGYQVKKADFLELTGYFLKPDFETDGQEMLDGIVNGSVEQHFMVTEEMTHTDFQIEIRMATYRRTNEGTLRVEVIQDENTYICDIDKSKIADNDWLNIEIRNHQFASGNAMLRITDPGNDIENCVTAYLIDTRQLGDLYFRDEKKDMKLCMRIKAIDWQ